LEIAELLAILNDLVVIVVSGLILVLLTVLTFMAFVLYRKLMPIIESTKEASDRVNKVTEVVHGQLGKSSNILLTVGSIFKLLVGLSRKKGKKDGKE
jgi:hypothetical protein